MIYILYLLLFISLLVVLQRKFISFNQVITTLSDITSKRNALEHEDLLTLFDKFNYEHGDGVCHGFTLTWAQEAALGVEHQFYNRLNLIKKEKETLPTSLQTITEKIKSSQTLSSKEQKRNEIKPFLEAICLAQSPDDYSEIYAQTIQQSDTDIIYKMIQLHLGKAQNTVKNLFGKTISVASPQEMSGFMHQLNHLLAIKNQVAVVCSSEEHTVGFKKHKDNTWLFMDINHLYEQSEEYPYQLLTSEELVPVLYQSLFETSKQLVFHCSFIAKTGQRKLAQQLRALDDLYPATPEGMQISNCRGYGPLALAVQNDDRNTVREILRLYKNAPLISQSALVNALFYAAACNRASIMNQLKNTPQMDINHPCDADENTPLGVACKYGNEAMVRSLLADKRINVDAQNAEAMTPLMLACASSYTQRNPTLFKLLLAAGANVALTNLDDETAFDIAKKHHNKVAMDIIATPLSKPAQQSNASGSHSRRSKPTRPAITGSFLNNSFLKRQDKSIVKPSQKEGFTETQQLQDEPTKMFYP